MPFLQALINAEILTLVFQSSSFSCSLSFRYQVQLRWMRQFMCLAGTGLFVGSGRHYCICYILLIFWRFFSQWLRQETKILCLYISCILMENEILGQKKKALGKSTELLQTCKIQLMFINLCQLVQINNFQNVICSQMAHFNSQSLMMCE